MFHYQPQGGDNSPDITSFLFPQACVINRGRLLTSTTGQFEKNTQSEAKLLLNFCPFPRSNIWTPDCLLCLELYILQQLQTVCGHWLLLLKVGHGVWVVGLKFQLFMRHVQNGHQGCPFTTGEEDKPGLVCTFTGDNNRVGRNVLLITDVWKINEERLFRGLVYSISWPKRGQ